MVVTTQQIIMRYNTRQFILFLSLTIGLIIFCYYYIDRQVVWFLAKHNSRDFVFLRILANDIINCIWLSIVIFYVYTAIQLQRNRPINKKLMLVSNSIVITIFLKDALKMVFGRYWAATFTCHNPSLLDNHVYGFNWLKQSSAYASFPSGHASMIFAFSTSLWFLFPRLRTLWVLIATLVLIGQIGMYYHFVSDIIAGAALGFMVASLHIKYVKYATHNFYALEKSNAITS